MMNSSSSGVRASSAIPNKGSGPGQGQPVKKLVIKPFKSQPKLPPNYEQDTWAKLALALHAVNAKVATDISKEELYRAVEDLCLHKFGGMVYDNLVRECEGHIFQQVDGLCEHLQQQGGSSSDAHHASSYHDGSFLAHVDRVWQEHCEQMNTVRNIFLYLDRSYALQTPGIRSLWDLGNYTTYLTLHYITLHTYTLQHTLSTLYRLLTYDLIAHLVSALIPLSTNLFHPLLTLLTLSHDSLLT